MQISEIFRRSIVIPLDKETYIQFRNGNINNVLNVHFLPLEKEEFEDLWKTKVFHKFNSILNYRISDYEDEYIKGNDIRLLKEIVKEEIKINNVENEKMILEKVFAQLDIFKELEYGVFFIF